MRLHLTAAVLVTSLAFLSAQEARPLIPALHAARDLRSLPFRHRYRYLDIAHLSEADREKLKQILDGHVNHLSTEPTIAKLNVVSGTGGSVLRVDLTYYGWSAELWEKLADVDPWYHVTVEIQDSYGPVRSWEGGVWPKDGKYYPRGAFSYTPALKAVKKRAIAPWVTQDAKEAMAYLIAETRSAVPIVRGDWFLWQTGVQAERNPGYYDFLGIKNAKTFETLVGFDKAAADKFKEFEQLEAVSKSGISRKPRRIGAFSTVREAPMFVTFDNKSATGKGNPLVVLNRKDFTHDAEERFGPLPNRLPATGLFDDKGNRQDTAPDFVGADTTAHGNDGRIHVNLCARCHAQDGGVLRNVDGWIAKTYRPPLRFVPLSEEEEAEYRILYGRNFQKRLDTGNRIFGEAITESCGLSAKEYGPAMARAFADYDTEATLERIARDHYTAPAELQQRIIGRIKAGVYVDPQVAELVHKGATLEIEQYHERIPLIMEIVRGK